MCDQVFKWPHIGNDYHGDHFGQSFLNHCPESCEWNNRKQLMLSITMTFKISWSLFPLFPTLSSNIPCWSLSDIFNRKRSDRWIPFEIHREIIPPNLCWYLPYTVLQKASTTMQHEQLHDEMIAGLFTRGCIWSCSVSSTGLHCAPWTTSIAVEGSRPTKNTV